MTADYWSNQIMLILITFFFLIIFQLPLSLLKTAQNHPMVSRRCVLVFLLPTFHPKMAGSSCSLSSQLVELKNGETYNGHLVSCDNWMNINLREVICTSRVMLRHFQNFMVADTLDKLITAVKKKGEKIHHYSLDLTNGFSYKCWWESLR